MNNLYKFILVLTLMLSYGFYKLFHDQPVTHNVVENHLDDSAHIKNMEKAFTGSWQASAPHSQIHTAIANLAESPGKINVVENKKVDSAKSEKKKKKKKDAAKKKTKSDRYVSKSKKQPDENPSNQNMAATGYAPPAPPTPAAPKTQKTIQEWYDFIVNPLNHENLDNLVLSYQSGLVDSATFYGVVDLLIDSNIAGARQLGVIALSATPSIQSFDRMVYFISKEKPGAALKSAQSLILNYKKTQNLIILNEVLSSATGALQLEAAELIRESANDLLAVQKPTNDGGTPPNRIIAAQYQREVQIFAQSLDLIQNIVTQTKTNPNPTFQQALTALQKLLKA